MNLSFTEKSVWISLVSTVLVYGYYFVRVFEQAGNPDFGTMNTLGLFVRVVIAIVVIEIVLHSLMAVAGRRKDGSEPDQRKDERDNLIDLKSARIAYGILGFGVVCSAGGVLFSDNAVLMANIILFFFILSEVVKFATQLFYYRRGF